jgi:hypothetical protein
MEDYKTNMEELLSEIRACDFSKNPGTDSYDWLILKCHQVLEHLRKDKTQQPLIDILSEVTSTLKAHRLDANPLVRERMISTQQDMIVYHLTVGYFKRNVLTSAPIFF